ENFIMRTLIFGLVMSALFAGVLGLILFARMTRRIRTMSEFAQEFEQENYSARIPVTSSDEISRLGSAFNAMADRIVQNMDALKNTDALRRELIANVSHDLRSPLASIQGYVETIQMKEDNISKQDLNQYLDIIHNSTVSLNRLVHELFDLSKLEARQIEPLLETFSISELAYDIVMKYKDQAEKQQVKLQADIQQPVGQVNGDIGLLERVLSNLILNAIEHTPEGGTVTVSLKMQEDGEIRLSISDTGPGIAENEIAHIFDRYYRGNRQYKRKGTSTGLGLSIAAKIIELHNSAIKVKNRQEGGAEFYFNLTAEA
ncbi:MAG: HAMP domain-containing histidine kinase, partial [FCB group bacterium]|nr:HAMP domain-containing histidine kinase [FCB group bacterium]